MGDTAANCLILLSVGECVGGGGESRVFRCKTCMEEFSSFQYLIRHQEYQKDSSSDMWLRESNGTSSWGSHEEA
ncbi:hypothetical protein F2Q69_00007442 [Brassica cretica]|uniref:C2H2-type domain-containing protein n=2 Tax=Brassica cretica TaxID=69181 RepID=A0A8S9PES4_BRACR|nr:hypothetical protein F2Q69_00007442 [Brassica cretica]KAF3545414.1 hypothetical protein DY000_02008169 [Brassica cretica]